jgi:hypothetical protein
VEESSFLVDIVAPLQLLPLQIPNAMLQINKMHRR